MQAKVTKITARQILDSRGMPTIEVAVFSDKSFAIASVPSGASTGVHEVLELRDGGKDYNGYSVLKACKNIETKIFTKIKNHNIFDQQGLDQILLELDGTPNKSKLGANAILAVSLAAARLAAKLSNQELYQYLAKLIGTKKPKLPTPLLNVLNGGLHADSGFDIQEFFIIPHQKSFPKQIESSWKVLQTLKKLLKAKNFSTAVGDEGGFAPRLGKNDKALRILVKAILESGFKLGKDFGLGLDAASSEFFDRDKEVYRLQADKKHYKPASIYRLYSKWQKQFNLEIIEDGCSEDDFLGWQKLTLELGHKTVLVGDDLFTTDPDRISQGIITGLANAVLIKPNQIGTLSETITAINLAKKFGYKVVLSHRSGETTDDFLADLSVAAAADYLKAGSLNRGERLAKYNRLLQIANILKQ